MSSPAPHILTVFAAGTAALACPHPAAECPTVVASSGWLTDVVDCLDLDPLLGEKRPVHTLPDTGGRL